jgi:hypothetical protein
MDAPPIDPEALFGSKKAARRYVGTCIMFVVSYALLLLLMGALLNDALPRPPIGPILITIVVLTQIALLVLLTFWGRRLARRLKAQVADLSPWRMERLSSPLHPTWLRLASLHGGWPRSVRAADAMPYIRWIMVVLAIPVAYLIVDM